MAISWSNYFRTFLHDGFGINVPGWMATDYWTARQIPGVLESAPHLFGVPIAFNFLAAAIVAALTVVLVWGIRESARFNAVMVIIKIIVLGFFVGVAFYFVSPAEMTQNWTPFQPQGWGGTLAGAAVVFFAYIGFDAVSTVAEETKNPSRDLPIGIIASLVVCTVIYVVVAAVFTGLIPYEELKTRLATETAEPLTMALDHVAPQAKWATTIVAFGSVVAHTAVLLVFQLGQPRIFMSMARDGLLPKVFTRVHPRFRTPHVTTILTGIVVGLLAGVANINATVDLTNIGTLFAFVLVCIGIPVLRLKDPQRHRPFRVPLGPFLLPLLGAASCMGLMYYLPPSSWWRFVGWLMLGMAAYASYGYNHSRLAGEPGRVRRASVGQKLGAVGFLLIAVALYVIPHDMSATRFLAALSAADDPAHGRANTGVSMIGIGLVLAVLGLVFGLLSRRADGDHARR